VPADCPVNAVYSIEIEAPPSAVWSRLVRAANWPGWYATASGVKIEGDGPDLGEGVRFRWRTFDVGLDTHVREWIPDVRIAWLATAIGSRASHAWLLVPIDHRPMPEIRHYSRSVYYIVNTACDETKQGALHMTATSPYKGT